MSEPSPDIPLTDSHCHLDFPQFDGEIDVLLARARARGVHRMVTICTKLAALRPVMTLAEAHDEIFFAAGTHPMSVASEPMVKLNDLLNVAEHPKCVGIGETGLDYHYTAESAEIQQQSLRIHIEASRQTGLPLIIHARDADDDMAQILTDEHSKGAFTCVMHCFSSSADLAKAALALDFTLSMSGIAAFPKSQDLRDIFATAPADRILVETDAPYLAPPPNRGKRNEPSYVADTALKAAEVFGMDYKDFAAKTEANFNRLFWKAAEWQN
ncbi:MAG: TatD family hydrolase [Boseongicola sp.]|nr:TatD family hydrolase [Boseongicola sp.]